MRSLCNLPAAVCALVSAIVAQDSRRDAFAAVDVLATYHTGGDRTALRTIERSVAALTDPADRGALARGLFDVLRNGQTPLVARQFAARQLEVVAGTKLVPLLAEEVATGESGVLAAQVLTRIPGEAATAAIREALPAAPVSARVLFAAELGRRNDGAAVEILAPLLGVREFDLVRAAARALGAIRSPDAVRALRRALRDSLGARRAEFAFALMRQVRRKVEDLSAAADAAKARERAARTFEQLLLPTEIRAVRLLALRGLARVRGLPALPRLGVALADRDEKVADLAAAEIPRLPGLVIDSALAAQLAGAARRTAVRVLLMEGLIRRGKPDAAPFFRRVLALRSVDPARDPRVDERAVALRGLAELLGAKAIPELVRYVSRGDRNEARAVTAVLARMPGANVEHAIAHRLHDGGLPPATRLVLVGALGQRRTRAAAFALVITVREDATFGVRRAALVSLVRDPGSLDVAGAVSILRSRRTVQERRLAEQLVVRIARRSENRDAACAAIERGFGGAGPASADPAQQRSLLAVLAGLGGARALRAVRTELLAPERARRSTALQLLARWPDVAAAPVLLAFARTAESATEHGMAVDGCLGLLREQAPADVRRLVAALRVARGAAERCTALRMLGRSCRPAALDPIVSSLATAELRNAAAHATVELVESLGDRSGTATALRAVLEVARDPDVRRRAEKLLRG